SNVRRPRLAKSAAIAAAKVVLPTPPLPTTSVVRGSESRSASSALTGSLLGRIARHADWSAAGCLAEPLAPGPHLAETKHDVGLSPHVLRVVDVAHLELHLQLHQLLLDGRIVGQLLFDDALHLAERPLDSSDGPGDGEEEQVGEKTHQSAFSSLN